LVPDIIKAISNNKTIEIRNPQATRPWQHVLEPLAGYLKLGIALLQSPGKFAEGWNFGPFMQDVYSVKQVAESIIHFSGKGTLKDLSKQEKLHEANLLMLDISKAVHKLNWNPVLSFNESIKLTVDWYMNAYQSNVLDFSRNQIKIYQEKWKSRN